MDERFYSVSSGSNPTWSIFSYYRFKDLFIFLRTYTQTGCKIRNHRKCWRIERLSLDNISCINIKEGVGDQFNIFHLYSNEILCLFWWLFVCLLSRFMIPVVCLAPYLAQFWILTRLIHGYIINRIGSPIKDIL